MVNFTFISRDEKKEYKKIFTRSYPLSHCVFQLESLNKYWKDIFKTNISFGDVLKMVNGGGTTETNFHIKKYHSLMDSLKINLKESSFFDEVLLKTEKILREYSTLASKREEYIQRIGEGSKEIILSTLEDYWDKCHKITTISWSFDIIGDALIEFLIEELRRDNKYDDLTFQKIISFDIISIFSREREEFLKLLSSDYKQEDLKSHLSKWSFLGMENPVSKPLEMKDFLIRIENLKGKDPAKELEKIENRRREEQEELKFIISSLNLSQETKNLLTKARTYLWYKNNERISLQKDVLESMEIFYAVYNKFNLPIGDWGFILWEEVLSIIRGNLRGEELAERIKSRKNKSFEIYLEKNKPVFLELNYKKSEVGLTLYGLVAGRGRATGEARLILNLSADYNKLNKGDILVTSMTTPDFVPLMEKASAIITDEGGTLCHAAIVSREMGIPCIVGTENATRLLTDGMLLEVDATSNVGLIKVLRRSN